ncbi:MAG: hydrogenase iron-sulfur subunit [Vampirovibrionales bacterium]|nr:hydrogenase iron-sulfur subunit [Vampirovibrionales bacterium]
MMATETLSVNAAPPAEALPPIRLIGLVCERSVELEDRLNADGRLLDDPSVKIILVPCSGIIQPLMMETSLKNGAQGCFATGCRIGDCHYREGNKFLQERLLGQRMPKLKPTVDKRRIEAYWLSAVEYDEFRELIESFQSTVSSIPAS